MRWRTPGGRISPDRRCCCRRTCLGCTHEDNPPHHDAPLYKYNAHRRPLHIPPLPLHLPLPCPRRGKTRQQRATETTWYTSQVLPSLLYPPYCYTSQVLPLLHFASPSFIALPSSDLLPSSDV